MKSASAKRQGQEPEFDLGEFLPYLLNQAAEATSRSFQKIYAEKHGMTRTQWRVLANLGQTGTLTAKDICRITHEEKTKVSRAVAALEQSGKLRRKIRMDDRRAEELRLTESGRALYRELGRHALEHDRSLRQQLGLSRSEDLVSALKALVPVEKGSTP